MKVRRIKQRKNDAYCAVVQKAKCFRTEEEAKRWVQQVDEILRIAAAAPALGLDPGAAVGSRFGSGGSGSAAA